MIGISNPSKSNDRNLYLNFETISRFKCEFTCFAEKPWTIRLNQSIIQYVLSGYPVPPTFNLRSFSRTSSLVIVNTLGTSIRYINAYMPYSIVYTNGSSTYGGYGNRSRWIWMPAKSVTSGERCSTKARSRAYWTARKPSSL